MKKGFTLIELLVVIGIVAVLSVVTLLLLNPAELLRQSRDATRVSDMSVLKNALAIYLTGVASPDLGSATTCYTSNATTTARCGELFSVTYTSTNATTSQGVNGVSGWLPVNLSALNSGAPIGTLPIDPINTAIYYYAYAANPATNVFELNANMESSKYMNGGPKNMESTDGGNSADWYEVGTAQGLAL